MRPMESLQTRSPWPALVLFMAAFFLRLFLAPGLGPFPKDVEVGVMYGTYGAEHGVTKLPDLFTERNWPVMYPPLFIYQAAAIGKIGANRLAALEKNYPDVAATWLRIRYKLLPIIYDMLTGILILLVLAKFVAPPWPLLGATFYLLNPCVVIDSAAWGHLDSIHSFFIALTAVCLGMTCGPRQDRWLVGAWLMFALAVCTKLQSIVMIPLLGVITLRRRNVAVAVAGVAIFALTVLTLYSPFLLAQRWDYFDFVFVRSFTEGRFTQINAFNFWGLGYVAPSTDKILGIISCAHLGQLASAICTLWLCYWLLKDGGAQTKKDEALRSLVVAGAFACVMPFMLLTQMRERYIAPAIPLLVLAACLDRRLLGVCAGFSLTYTLNLLHVQRHIFGGPEEMAVVNASNFALRVFGCLLNIGLFAWFTYRLPVLVRSRLSSTA